MLEGFFSNGSNYSNSKIKDDFRNSRVMDFAIELIFQNMKKQKNDVNYKWFRDTCKKYNQIENKDGLIHILVEERGKLSHFSTKNTKEKRNPFNDDEYRSIAFIAMMICRFSSIKLRLLPFRQDKHPL